MSRFILRFTGRGAMPESDLAQIRAAPGVTVLDRSSPHLLLVQASPQAVSQLVEALPHWAYSPEQTIPLPDPRPKARPS